jgi:hypothetical protein
MDRFKFKLEQAEQTFNIKLFFVDHGEPFAHFIKGKIGPRLIHGFIGNALVDGEHKHFEFTKTIYNRILNHIVVNNSAEAGLEFDVEVISRNDNYWGKDMLDYRISEIIDIPKSDWSEEVIKGFRTGHISENEYVLTIQEVAELLEDYYKQLYNDKWSEFIKEEPKPTQYEGSILKHKFI